MTKKRVIKVLLYALLLLGVAFSMLASKFPQLIEYFYARKLYYWTVRPYSLLTGIFPFSLAELIVVGTSIFLLYKVGKGIINLSRKRRNFGRGWLKMGGRLTLIVVFIYLIFNAMWGLNYSRMSFAEISGLPMEPASANELSALALDLTNRANELREQVLEDNRGVTTLPKGIRDMFGRAHLGYERVSKIYPELGGLYGRPKGIMLSHYWSYTGISGVYFPYTAEANVNINMPHFMLPVTTLHEMAHQRGFAREDEANYIAYLTCKLHPDADFQYSGVIFALLSTMNALQRYDPETRQEIRALYSEGLERDLKDWREYIERYQGPLEQLSTSVNNTYLKANRQGDGVRSYGRMVDLLLAEFRRTREGFQTN